MDSHLVSPVVLKKCWNYHFWQHYQKTLFVIKQLMWSKDGKVKSEKRPSLFSICIMIYDLIQLMIIGCR